MGKKRKEAAPLRGGLDTRSPEDVGLDVCWAQRIQQARLKLLRWMPSLPWVEAHLYRAAAFPPPCEHPGHSLEATIENAAILDTAMRDGRIEVWMEVKGVYFFRCMNGCVLHGMVTCRGCGHLEPRYMIGSSGHCDTCRYASMTPTARSMLQGSTSAISLAKIRTARARKEIVVSAL